RSDALPDLPTIGDFVPGYQESNWWGFGAPKNTPPAIVDKLNQEINAALADPRIKARLADLGGTVLAGSPAAFGMLAADETEKLGGVVKSANIKPECSTLVGLGKTTSNDPSPPTFSAARRGHRRAPGRHACRMGPSLPDAAGADCVRLPAGWRGRHLRAADRAVAVGADGSAIHRRDQAGRGRDDRR